ncbi:methyl-accepting chemotaxis protein [Ferrovibrio sp.]|uniref:methyl-accepting chemotaxis protein n=1 Tax=Ferrovibrio sp. TaxID=1917215 RepID=UPI001B7B0BD7|nr:methyl-accepting chemotaxis protein [Ferrovibrio sp.]MBP7066179.1 HAMP domain-containing protein [Ferrovibrio sp.]
MTQLLARIGLGGKIYFIVLLAALLAGGMTYLGIDALRTYNAKLAQIERETRQAVIAEQVNGLINAVVMESRGIYMSQTNQEADRYGKLLLAGLQRIDGLMQEWRSLLPATLDTDRAAAFTSVKQFIEFRTELVRLGVQETPAKARVFGDNEANRSNRQALNRAVQLLAKDNAENIHELRIELDAYFNRHIQRIAVIGSGGLVIMLLLSLLLARKGIIAPLNALSAAMGRLARDEATSVPGADRGDEIGAMARHVEVFSRNAEEKRRLETVNADQQQASEQRRLDREARDAKASAEIAAFCDHIADGDLTSRLAETGKEGFQLALTQQLNRLSATLASVTGELAHVLAGMAEGDLSRTISTEYRGVFGDLKQSVNDTAAKLRDVALRLGGSAHAVQSASAEISSGSQDLAGRTEAQAASIEETAASMHEVTATVRQNADNAAAANQLSQVARDAADKGGSVVQDAVQAMGGIEDGARRISDIVALIDEIAFQTNLLALNASVEAARAGEAGKGFAVVAQEVRALAQRSANASKDIKALIAASNAQVRQGVALVNQAGGTLGEIVSSIKKVSDIVAEIAAASREQATGLDQVNTAVSNMDEMTQRNAALVEQNTASAQSLADQARELAGLVAFFRIGANAAARMPAPLAPKVSQTPKAAPAASLKPNQPIPAPAMSKPAAAKMPPAKPVAARPAAPPVNAGDDDWKEF